MASSSRVAAFSRRRRSSSAACQVCWSTTGGRALVVWSVMVSPGLGRICSDVLTRDGHGNHRARARAVELFGHSVQSAAGMRGAPSYELLVSGRLSCVDRALVIVAFQ